MVIPGEVKGCVNGDSGEVKGCVNGDSGGVKRCINRRNHHVHV